MAVGTILRKKLCVHLLIEVTDLYDIIDLLAIAIYSKTGRTYLIVFLLLLIICGIPSRGPRVERMPVPFSEVKVCKTLEEEVESSIVLSLSKLQDVVGLANISYIPL